MPDTLFIIHFPGGAACATEETIRGMVSKIIDQADSLPWADLVAQVHAKHGWNISA